MWDHVGKSSSPLDHPGAARASWLAVRSLAAVARAHGAATIRRCVRARSRDRGPGAGAIVRFAASAASRSASTGGCQPWPSTSSPAAPASSDRRSARALLARGDRVRVIDNFSSGKRENLADIADATSSSSRATSATTAALRARRRRRRGGLPRGGDPVGAAVDGRADREPRGQRHRHAARARRGAARRRAARGLRGVVGGLRRRRRRCPRSRPCAPAPISPYGGVEAGRRALLPGLRARLRPGDGLPALLQRVRPAPGSEVGVRGGDPEVHHRGAGRQARRASSATARSRATSATSTTSSRRTSPRRRRRRAQRVGAACSTSPAAQATDLNGSWR